MVREDMRPSRILTREAFENAIVVASALGASSNCPPHLIAMARHAGIDLSLDDWQRLGEDVPLLANCVPAGEHLGEGFHRAGGVPAVLHELQAAGRLHDGCLTVSGQTIGEIAAAAKTRDPDVIRSCAAAQAPRRLHRAVGQFLRQRGHQDVGGGRGLPPRLPVRARRRERLRGARHRVRRPRGLSRAHRGSGAEHRRALHPGDPGRRHGGLSRQRRGGQHGPALAPDQARHRLAALPGRRPPERHLGQPLDPEHVAGSRRGRRAGAAAPATASAST